MPNTTKTSSPAVPVKGEEAPAAHKTDSAAVRRVLECGGVFASFYLLFSLSTMLINAKTAVVYDSGSVTLFYALGLVATAAGFAGFGLLFRQSFFRRFGPAVFGAVYAASLMCVLFSDSRPLFTVSAFVCPLAYGYLGGAVHYFAAVRLGDSSHKGAILGSAFCLTVSVQFVIQSLSLPPVAYAAILTAALALILWRLLACREAAEPIPRVSRGADKRHSRSLWIMAAIVVFLAMMVGIYDGISARLYAENAVNLAGWTRLMVGVGALLSGFLFDLNCHTPMNIIVLCTALVNTVAVLLLSTTNYFLLSHLLFSGSTGFYIVYVMAGFISEAPESGDPPMWAGAGRIAHSLAMAVTASLAGVFSAMAPAALDAVALTLFVVTLLLFIFSGRLAVGKAHPAVNPPTSDQRLALFASRYALTPRETEVLAAVSANEYPLNVIAGELGISERVVQRHLTSIYEKTGTRTRYALVLALHGIELGSPPRQ